VPPYTTRLLTDNSALPGRVCFVETSVELGRLIPGLQFDGEVKGEGKSDFSRHCQLCGAVVAYLGIVRSFFVNLLCARHTEPLPHSNFTELYCHCSYLSWGRNPVLMLLRAFDWKQEGRAFGHRVPPS